jgi:quercetin dioxygenase-like cupin family protein
MFVTKVDKSKRYVVTAENAPGHVDPEWVGKVFRQGLTDGKSVMRVGIADFEDGSVSALHKHGSDQIIMITEGVGICTTESEEIEVHPGDCVLFRAGELHTHGAKPGHSMSHYAVSIDPKMK